MTDRFNLEQIRKYWQQQALEYGQSPSASWSDHYVIGMEIREILKYLEDGQSVLDVGCANGYSTIRFASEKRIQIRGVDYIPEMIEQAHGHLNGVQDNLRGTAEFAVGDITALAEPAQTFDRVIVVRVVINLGNWETQLRGLHECVRVLKPGGLLLLSEATVQGWQKLNAFRREWGLNDIPMPPFNQYLDQDQVIEAVSSELGLIELVNFASTYYLGTRVLKPLLIQALGAHVNVADPDMQWNRWFSELPAWGDYGTQKLFVFEKK